MNVVDPILTTFFNPNDLPNLIYHGNDHVLYESKLRKMEQYCNNSKGRIPDRSIEINNSNNHIFLCGIKTEKQSKNRPDLVKLAYMTKDRLDTAIKKGVNYNDYWITGLLIERRTCTLYCMDLTAPKLYRMTEFAVFFSSYNQ